jgi:hypothetical protein
MLAFTRNLLPRRSLPGAARSAMTAVVALLGALPLAACADQPEPRCISTTATFAVKLIEVGDRVESVPNACGAFGPDGFNADPEVGLAPFYVRGSNGQPDYDHGSLAVQTAELGSLFYTAEGFDVGNAAADGQLYSMGDFNSTHTDDDHFCTVPTLSLSRVVLPPIAAIVDDPATADVDESFPGQAALDATLEWSNLRVYVTADTFGTQMDAQLLDTRVSETGDSCAISYRALGLAPAVSCAATDPESGDPLTNPDGSPQLDPTLCDPQADPAAGRVLGSGISPNARYACDAATAFCMIEGDTIPALQ